MKLIGISCSLTSISDKLDGSITSIDYSEGIAKAGGLPVLIPFGMDKIQIQALCERLDGLLLTGGDDVDPLFYGEDPMQGLGNVNPERDQLEFWLLDEMMKQQKPILGICRGMQLINVALGGSLYQDLVRQVKHPLLHRQKAARNQASHLIHIKPGTRLSLLACQETMRVNSFHHQSVKQVAPGLLVSATAADGVIEAIESLTYPYLVGVQWHPENLWRTDSFAFGLFENFISACPPNRD